MSSRSPRSKLVPSVLILSALFAAPQFVPESRGADEKIVARAAAVGRPAVVDCSKIKLRAETRPSSPRVSDSLAQVGTAIKLNDEHTPSLTNGVWSPTGDSIAFVAPTDRILPLKSGAVSVLAGDPNQAPSRAVAVSVNEIWLYQFTANRWSKITDDGARPSFSKDGKRLLYLSSTKGARAVDMETLADEALGAPEAGDPNRRFQTALLSDGSVLASGESGGPLRHVVGSGSAWSSIELAPQDEIRISPNEESMAVIYNASVENPTSAVVVYDKSGKATTLLKNCPASALHLAWSQDGRSLAYPMRATGQSEVWVSSLDGGPPQTKVRLQPTEGIGALSLSPDGNSIAFSHTSHKGKEAIWISNQKGMQRVASGFLGQLSLQGDRLLYAVRRSGGGFDWYVVPVELQ